MTTPEERGIIWTDSSALAILNTRLDTYPGEAIDSSKPAKWQTRRLLNPQPCTDKILFDEKTATATFPSERGKRIDLRCPLGVPGDLLYGRETWATYPGLDGDKPSKISGNNDHNRIWYRAGGPPLLQPSGLVPTLDPAMCHGRWRSSIHMPKIFARIWHEIVDVRVEKLRQIQSRDVFAEGFTKPWSGGGQVMDSDAFRKAWIDIRGAGSWAENPWVWVLGLRRIER